jgi:quercetin 2,3-dioxygenase
MKRNVTRRVRGMPTSDGAGVKLKRVIGSAQLDILDPFLLLDEFGTDNPGDYIAGFPDHPHRGFETVTYMLDGRMRHKDNHGHEGVLGPGSVQWMTAGRGIVHSEMPEQQEGRMRGLQLWLNLPGKDKMTVPKYQEFGPEKIPLVTLGQGVQVHVIAGTAGGQKGPISQSATDPTYLDVELPQGGRFTQTLPAGHTAFLFVLEGSAAVLGDGKEERVDAHELAVLSEGDVLELEGRQPDSGAQVSRVVLIAGRPLREQVARYGPVVMNTREELVRAFEDFQAGRF